MGKYLMATTLCFFFIFINIDIVQTKVVKEMLHTCNTIDAIKKEKKILRYTVHPFRRCRVDENM